MKMKLSKLSIFLFSALVILSIPLTLADEYVTTQAYFYIPSDVSFSVKLPGKAAIPSNPTPGSASTTWISFNASTGNDIFVQPQTEGLDINQQNGPLYPIFLVTNDGNTPIKIKLQIAALDSCLKLCANATCGVGGCGTASFISTCTNIASEQEIVTNLPYTDGQDRANVTLYANFTNCAVGQYGGPSGYAITHHSTV